MQIKAAFIQNPAGVLDLFQREVKKRTVVCLKLDAAILYQKSVIPLQKLTGGQAAFCVPVLWPWIGEVQVYFGNLARRKILINVFCIHSKEQKIVTFQFLPVIQCPDKHAGIFLDADIVDSGILPCHLQNKLALTHADLDVDRMVIVEEFFCPSAPVIGTISTVGLYRVFVF